MATINYDVTVLGAGVAGLACADEIVRNSKRSVLVLEKNRWIGGLAATIETDGFRYDLAPHRWFTKNDELNRWIDELMGDELIWVSKHTPIFQFGKFFEYPIKIGDVVKKIDLRMQIVMGLTYAYEKTVRRLVPRKIVNMKDAYISRFGWGLYKWFNEEYNEKLWGEGGCVTMSPDFVNQRMKNLSMVTAMLHAMGVGKNKVVSLVEKFRYPKMGVGRISERLKERIRKNGGVVLLGEGAVGISKTRGGYKVTTETGSYLTNILVSSIPIEELIRMGGEKMVEKIKKELNKLSYVDQKIVVLTAKKPRLTDFTWVYIHPKDIMAFRFMETNNWSNTMSPKGKTSLVFEYPYHQGGEVEKMSDTQLIDRSMADFIKFFAVSDVKKSDFIGGRVYKIAKAYPKYDLNYAKSLAKIKKYVEKKMKGTVLIGRNGMFHYNNMDHSIYTGLLAARNIISGKKLFDLEKINNEAEYLEEIKR